MVTRAPDGGWGWIIVFAYFCISVISDGIRYSYGVMFISLLEAFGRGKGETAWVGGLMAGTSNIVGPLVTKATDHFGCRAVAVAGSLMASLGLFVSVFAKELCHLYITLGLMTGCGYGMIFLTSTASITRYFDKRRSLAMGLSVCGSGIGAIIFNPFSKWLLDEYGWRGTLLIESGLVLNCVAFSALYRPLRDNVSDVSKQYKDDGVLLERRSDFSKREQTLSYMQADASCDDGCYAERCSARYGCSSMYSKNQRKSQKTEPDDKIAESSSFLQITQGGCANPVDLSVKSANSQEETSCKVCSWDLLRFSLLKDPSFLIFFTSGFLIALAYNVPYIHLPDLATKHGYSKSAGVLLISYLGVANTISRVVFGVIGDRPKVSRTYLYNVTNITCGVFTGFVSLFTDYGLLIMYAVVYGITSGGSVSLATLVAGDLFSVHVITESIGLFMLACGLANFIGTLLAGWFFDVTGSYTVTFIATGVVLVLSGAILFIIPCIRRTKHKT